MHQLYEQDFLVTSMPVSSSRRAIKSQSVQILFLTSLINGPIPVSVDLEI